MVVVVGPNNAGKSVMLRGIYKKVSGEQSLNPVPTPAGIVSL